MRRFVCLRWDFGKCRSSYFQGAVAAARRGRLEARPGCCKHPKRSLRFSPLKRRLGGDANFAFPTGETQRSAACPFAAPWLYREPPASLRLLLALSRAGASRGAAGALLAPPAALSPTNARCRAALEDARGSGVNATDLEARSGGLGVFNFVFFLKKTSRNGLYASID